MKIFVTGATGFIGLHLCNQLAKNGHTVHALYRSKEKAKALEHSNIRLFKGDILDTESLQKAMQGCTQVYHVAAYANLWAKDPKWFYDLNVKGALNVFGVAKKTGVDRTVFTSTAGTISPSGNDQASDESTLRTLDYFNDYERSKAEAEEAVRQLVKEGQDIVIVNPSRVFGPGLLSKSNSVTLMIDKYVRGKFHTLPGNGESVGNYVYVKDVVEGHIKAMEKGRAGERYILGGENVSFNAFFELLISVSGKKYRLFKVPLFVIFGLAYVMHFRAKWFGIAPLITPPWVRKYMYNWRLSNKKAEQELGYRITPLKEAFRKTLHWLKE